MVFADPPLGSSASRQHWISTILAAVLFSVALFFFRKTPDQKLSNNTFSVPELLFRVAFAGSFIALSVFLGKVLGPLWGGMFASFPAAFSSSLFILERKHGIDFTASVAKTMPYGSMGNVLFALILFLLASKIGILLGLLIAYSASLLFALTYLNIAKAK